MFYSHLYDSYLGNVKTGEYKSTGLQFVSSESQQSRLFYCNLGKASAAVQSLETVLSLEDKISGQVLTVLLPGIIRSINLSRSKKELPEINFSFISSRLQICKLPEFGFYYALIKSEEISHLLRTTAIATTHTLARKNSPGGIRKISNRVKTVTFNQGLQTASAHSQYLGRWNMMTNGKPIPSVKTINISTEKEKRDSILLHHLSIELCKSKFGVSPFEIPDTFSSTYKRVRSELRIAFINSLDPLGIVQRNHQINPAEIAESITGKGNEGLLIHSDQLNCPVLDTTLSLTSLHTIEELVADDEVTVDDIHRSFDVSKGLVAANILGYTRMVAHQYSEQAAHNIDSIASTKTDELTSLCIRLLSEPGIAFDYQGYLWETEESFDERATHLAEILHNENPKWIDTVREICGSDRKILRSSACFEKMGFYSIYLHVLLSMHAHGFIKNKWNVRCLSYFLKASRMEPLYLLPCGMNSWPTSTATWPLFLLFTKRKGKRAFLFFSIHANEESVFARQ